MDKIKESASIALRELIDKKRYELEELGDELEALEKVEQWMRISDPIEVEKILSRCKHIFEDSDVKKEC